MAEPDMYDQIAGNSDLNLQQPNNTFGLMESEDRHSSMEALSTDELGDINSAYDSGSGESYNESRHTNSYSRNIRSALRHKKTREREEQKTKKMKKKMAFGGMLTGGDNGGVPGTLYTRLDDSAVNSVGSIDNSVASRIGEIRRPNSSRHSLQSVELQSVADGGASVRDSRQRTHFLSSPYADTSRTINGAVVSPRVQSKHDFVWKEWKSSKYKYYFRTCSFCIVVVQWLVFLRMLSDDAPPDSSVGAVVSHAAGTFVSGDFLSPTVLHSYGAVSHELLFDRGHLRTGAVWRLFSAGMLATNSVELLTNSVLLFFLGGYVSLLIQFTSLYNERGRLVSSSGPSGGGSDVTLLNNAAYFNFFPLYLLSSAFGVSIRVMSTQAASMVLASAPAHLRSPPIPAYYTGGAYGIVGILSAWAVWLCFRWSVVPGKTMRQRRTTQLRSIAVWLGAVIFYSMFRYDHGDGVPTDKTCASFALFSTCLHGIIVAALFLRHEIVGDRNSQIQIRIGAIACLFAIYVGIALYIMPT